MRTIRELWHEAASEYRRKPALLLAIFVVPALVATALLVLSFEPGSSVQLLPYPTPAPVVSSTPFAEATPLFPVSTASPFQALPEPLQAQTPAPEPRHHHHQGGSPSTPSSRPSPGPSPSPASPPPSPSSTPSPTSTPTPEPSPTPSLITPSPAPTAST